MARLLAPSLTTRTQPSRRRKKPQLLDSSCDLRCTAFFNFIPEGNSKSCANLDTDLSQIQAFAAITSYQWKQFVWASSAWAISGDTMPTTSSKTRFREA